MTKISGFDEFQKQIDKFSKNIKEIDGSHNVPLEELLNESFMHKYTQFSNLSELIEKSSFEVNSVEAFKAIPDNDWDQYISSVSNFQNWSTMLNKATEFWALKKLGF